jgi:spore germination protein KB
MLGGRNKISLRQALILMLAGIFSPAIRVLPSYTAEEAEQAAWLAPLPAMPILFLLFLGLKTVFDAYPAASLTDIIKTVLGKYLGNLVVICYLLWIFLLVLLYTRYHADRFSPPILLSHLFLSFLSYEICRANF